MFKTFSQAIHARFSTMSKEDLYVVNLSKDDIWAAYLAAFPEGTNPIYKERTEHDCNCCKNFIKNLGLVVSLKNGKLQSVWDVPNLPTPYKEVAAALNALVTGATISDLFRTTEASFGVSQSLQKLNDGSIKKWNHFYGTVAPSHKSATPDKARGDYRTTVQVFKRGLEELQPSALSTVLDLIASNSLYRGAEHEKAVKAFQKLQQDYTKADNKDNFAWANAGSPASRFRNTAIGTLVQDLSEGTDLAAAVASFESKVAPTNYKRTTALITPAMVKSAMATVETLGLAPSLERRFARLSDITVNNVLWVDNTVAPLMKGGLEGLLQATASKVSAKAVAAATDIGIEEFMNSVLPTASSMDLVVNNHHQSNFMSMTAPVHGDSKNLFQWSNDFGWSYEGNITDSIRERVKKAGGNVTNAKLRFSLAWFNYDDLDLYVTEPCGTKVYFSRKHGSNAVLDVDMNANCGRSRCPVENVSLNRTADGTYIVEVRNFCKRESSDVGFTIEVENDGKLSHYLYNKAVGNCENIEVGTFTIKDGKLVGVSLGGGMIKGSVSNDKWGIMTETPVKVKTVMFSPNYWDDNHVGNKHWFFILDNCKNPDATRGIYNEFLSNKLVEHSKVFEVLGDKTKCQPTEEQLSGVGFSSTKRDSVTVMVTSNNSRRTYNINF